MTHTDIGGRNYCDVRDGTERLAAPLSPEDQVVQSMPDASPAKWHRAHTTWFFEEFVLRPARGGLPGRSIRTYRYLFNSYYEAVGARQPRPQRRPDHPADRGRGRPLPPAGRRRHGRRCSTAASTGRLGDLVELGLHHEQQHQELLLMDIKHLLAPEPAPSRLPRDCTPSPDPWAHPGR